MRERVLITNNNKNHFIYLDNKNKFSDAIDVYFGLKTSEMNKITLPYNSNITTPLYYIKLVSDLYTPDELMTHLKIVSGDIKLLINDNNLYITNNSENEPYMFISETANYFIKSDIVVAPSEPVQLIKNLVNCTIEPDITELENNTEYNFKLISFNNYIFNEVPTFSYYDKNNNYKTIPFIKTDDYTYTLKINYEYYNNSSATINAAAIENPSFNIPVKTHFINYQWINEVKEIPNNSQDVITLSIIPSYNLSNPSTTIIPYCTYTAYDETIKQLNFSLIKDDVRRDFYQLEISNISFKKNSIFEIYANSYECKALFNTSNIINSIIEPELPEYYTIDTFNPGIYKCTANPGYIFNTKPKLIYTDSLGRERTIDSVLSETKKTASFNLSNDIKVDDNTIIYIYSTAIPEVKQYEISSIYNPSDEQLKELNKKRFYEIKDPIPPYGANQVDLGQFILSLRKFFINFDNYYKNNILLGSYDTSIVSNVIPNYTKEISCGINRITGIYNNSVDYNHSKIQFNLPFVGLKEIEPYKVLNKNVEIKYIININNGDCMVKIIADNTIVETYNGIISINIPYILTTISNGYSENVYNDNNTDTIALYHVTPEVIIKENNLLEHDNLLYGISTVKYDKIKNNTGFIKLNNVHINNIAATSKELDLLELFLKNGIILLSH